MAFGGPGGALGRGPGSVGAPTAGPSLAGDRQLLRRVAGLFTTHRRRLLVIAAAILASSGLGVVTPFLTQRTFDDALFVPGGPDLRLLGVLVGLSVLVPMLSALIGVGQTYLTTVLGNRVMADLRSRLFEHLQSMELAFFTTTKTGAIQSRLANDVGGVQSVLTETASSIMSNVVTVTASLVAMLLLSWQLTLVALALMPLFIWLQTRVGRVRRELAGRTQSSLSDMTAITQETLSVSGILLAKVFNRQATEVARYRAENERQVGLQVRQTMTGQSFFAVVQTFFGVTPALVYLVAGLSLSRGTTITTGTIVAFTTLQSRLIFPVIQLLRVSLDVQTSLALFSRIFEYLDLRPALTDAPDAAELPREQVRGDVRLDSVWFHYPGQGGRSDAAGPAGLADAAGLAGLAEAAGLGDAAGWALRGVDLRVGPGQLAAIVGPSGAGKTTLSYLVPRLYDVQRGAVLLDGHDVRSLAMPSLADAVGMVTQDTYLFHATIGDNLRYAQPDATDADLAAAARAANIHDRIISFDDGYDTVVGERGYRLSGGERQRLAIARVILKDPRVLILDEATSALDTTSERLVQQALETVMAGRTTIAIAHRLSTILGADVIFAVDGGRVVESGTHDELLALDGLYARLYYEQFGGGKVQARCADGVVFADGVVMPHGSSGRPADHGSNDRSDSLAARSRG
jgi:ATP-binding cassette, subfamily B, bacterial